MKNSKKGFVIPLIIAIVAILAVGGIYYTYNWGGSVCWPYCKGMTDQDREAIKQSMIDAGATTSNPIVGGDSDIHGCKASAGYSWCEEKNKCLRVWEEGCSTASTQPSITVLSPNGGDNYPINVKTFQINYLTNNIGSSTLSIDLVSDSGQIINLAKSIKNTGIFLGYLGNIPNLTPGKYKITITCWDKTYFSKDSSDDYFTITAKPVSSCAPNWSCGWGACTNGYQGMTAVDSNNCGLPSTGVSIICPALARECAVTN